MDAADALGGEFALRGRQDLVAANLASQDFTHTFAVGAVCGAAAVVVAAVLVPAVRRPR